MFELNNIFFYLAIVIDTYGSNNDDNSISILIRFFHIISNNEKIATWVQNNYKNFNYLISSSNFILYTKIKSFFLWYYENKLIDREKSTDFE